MQALSTGFIDSYTQIKEVLSESITCMLICSNQYLSLPGGLSHEEGVNRIRWTLPDALSHIKPKQKMLLAKKS